MGYLKDLHGLTLVGNVPEGKCPVCGTEHRPDAPHNKQSLVYQYQFYDEHGRWPTWEDAMEHCSDEVKMAWQEVIEQLGEENK